MSTKKLEEILQHLRPLGTAKKVEYEVPSKLRVDGPPPIVFITQADIHVGDCTLHAGAQFQYGQDGGNGWFAKVSSTDTGDEMKVSVALCDRSNSCNDGNNFDGLLDAVGEYGKDIHDANVIKDWEQTFGIDANIFANPGIGPLEVYTRATCAIIMCSC